MESDIAKERRHVEIVFSAIRTANDMLQVMLSKDTLTKADIIDFGTCFYRTIDKETSFRCLKKIYAQEFPESVGETELMLYKNFVHNMRILRERLHVAKKIENLVFVLENKTDENLKVYEIFDRPARDIFDTSLDYVPVSYNKIMIFTGIYIGYSGCLFLGTGGWGYCKDTYSVLAVTEMDSATNPDRLAHPNSLFGAYLKIKTSMLVYTNKGGRNGQWICGVFPVLNSDTLLVKQLEKSGAYGVPEVAEIIKSRIVSSICKPDSSLFHKAVHVGFVEAIGDCEYLKMTFEHFLRGVAELSPSEEIVETGKGRETEESVETVGEEEKVEKVERLEAMMTKQMKEFIEETRAMLGKIRELEGENETLKEFVLGICERAIKMREKIE